MMLHVCTPLSPCQMSDATMDARKLTYEANSFDGVIDKGKT